MPSTDRGNPLPDPGLGRNPPKYRDRGPAESSVGAGMIFGIALAAVMVAGIILYSWSGPATTAGNPPPTTTGQSVPRQDSPVAPQTEPAAPTQAAPASPAVPEPAIKQGVDVEQSPTAK
jgi:hypothetical protein